MSFNNYKHYLAKLAKSNSRSIERARPYYNACQKAKEVCRSSMFVFGQNKKTLFFKAQIDTQQAAHEYQDSVEFYYTAQENLTLAQIQKSQSDLKSWQEFFDQAKQKVKEKKNVSIFERRTNFFRLRFSARQSWTRQKAMWTSSWRKIEILSRIRTTKSFTFSIAEKIDHKIEVRLVETKSTNDFLSIFSSFTEIISIWNDAPNSISK